MKTQSVKIAKEKLNEIVIMNWMFQHNVNFTSHKWLHCKIRIVTVVKQFVQHNSMQNKWHSLDNHQWYYKYRWNAGNRNLPHTCYDLYTYSIHETYVKSNSQNFLQSTNPNWWARTQNDKLEYKSKLSSVTTITTTTAAAATTTTTIWQFSHIQNNQHSK